MESKTKPYVVYVKTDDENRIEDVNSSGFLRNADGWTEIDRGYSQRHHHAHGNYFPLSIRDERGIKRYKAYAFVDAPTGEIISRYFKDDVEYVILERAQEEMDADYAARPAPPPSDKERIAQLEEELKAAKILLGLEV